MNGNNRTDQQYQQAEKDVVVDHLEDCLDPGQPPDIPAPAAVTLAMHGVNLRPPTQPQQHTQHPIWIFGMHKNQTMNTSPTLSATIKGQGHEHRHPKHHFTCQLHCNSRPRPYITGPHSRNKLSPKGAQRQHKRSLIAHQTVRPLHATTTKHKATSR